MVGPRQTRRFKTLLAALAWVALGGSLACACTIPVFRYALERWESDPYFVVVYHRGEVSDQEKARIDGLAARAKSARGTVNIEVLRYDLAAANPPQVLDIAASPATSALPWVEVRARTNSGRTEVRWQGTLAEAAGADSLLDSPARREIVRRLLAGDSCVWLLLAPREQLPGLTQQMESFIGGGTVDLMLPRGIGESGSEVYSQVPLQIRFSVLPIAHEDEGEKAFLKLVAASSRELKRDAAYVLPVFGRGRALELFDFADAGVPLVQDVGTFLCSACSCRVKQANPGFDLLVAAAWHQELFGDAPAPPAIAAGAANSPVSAPAPDYVAIPAGDSSAETKSSTDRSDRSSEGAAAASDGQPRPTSREQHEGVWPLLIAVALLGTALLGTSAVLRR